MGARQKSLVTSFFEPPQATIGLQRSVLPGIGGHWCTAPFVFYESNLAYVTVPIH